MSRTRGRTRLTGSLPVTCAVLAAAAVLAVAALPASALAQDQGEQDAAARKLPTIAEKTAAMKKLDGFFPLYWDASAGKLWMEIGRLDTEVLHMSGVAAGLGSNDIGIDRAQVTGSEIVKFQRIGPKVLMVEPNFHYRASSDNPAEVRAVTDAFARSVLFGFTVAAETDSHVLVDVTEWLVRDDDDIAGRLRPGTYKLDVSRSAVSIDNTANFPENTEMEALITFVRQPGGSGGGQGGGRQGGAFDGVGDVAATGSAATLRMHQSFIQLPDDDYEPRRYDPRAGFGSMQYEDYAVPLSQPMIQRFIRRHRLKKQDPSAAVSDPVEPIIYYMDPGTPEPVRSALMDGARWWNQAFEAAGYRNAFRVELLPDSINPLDIRYNVVNWVHRSTRGWSYGNSVTDPRTGEIIKGIVSLDSRRMRQDYMIAEGLLSPYASGDETPPELSRWTLARVRQLAAHEIGHTLGLAHNYYDSEQGRISVMDYPHPLIKLTANGRFDTSDVYDTGIGEWDKVAITYGYQDFSAGTDVDSALDAILASAWQNDIRFMTNQDMEANPRVDQWSNGTDPAAELERMLEVRRVALARFGENAIRRGTPMATIEEVLVPLYLHHRHQVEAAASALGGQNYIYAMRGDGRTPVEPVSGEEQRAALDALMMTLEPSALVLPESLLGKIPPRPMGYGRTRELFPRYTGSTFDAITPAVVAAEHTVSNVLQPERAARIVEQHAIDPSLPGLGEVIDRLYTASFGASPQTPYEAAVNRAVESVVVDRIASLAARAAMPQVRAIAMRKLEARRGDIARAITDADELDAAHYALITHDIDRALDRPLGPYTQPEAPVAPPGAPIGEPAMDWLDGGLMRRWLSTVEPPCSKWNGGW